MSTVKWCQLGVSTERNEEEGLVQRVARKGWWCPAQGEILPMLPLSAPIRPLSSAEETLQCRESMLIGHSLPYLLLKLLSSNSAQSPLV